MVLSLCKFAVRIKHADVLSRGERNTCTHAHANIRLLSFVPKAATSLVI